MRLGGTRPTSLTFHEIVDYNRIACCARRYKFNIATFGLGRATSLPHLSAVRDASAPRHGPDTRRRHKRAPEELYDIAEDQETRNLIDDVAHREVTHSGQRVGFRQHGRSVAGNRLSAGHD